MSTDTQYLYMHLATVSTLRRWTTAMPTSRSPTRMLSSPVLVIRSMSFAVPTASTIVMRISLSTFKTLPLMTQQLLSSLHSPQTWWMWSVTQFQLWLRLPAWVSVTTVTVLQAPLTTEKFAPTVTVQTATRWSAPGRRSIARATATRRPRPSRCSTRRLLT